MRPILMHTAALALGLAAAAASRAETPSAQPLTGAARARAIATMTRACLDTYRTDEDMQDIDRPVYCACFARRFVDGATTADLVAEESPRTQAIVREAATTCYEEASPGGR